MNRTEWAPRRGAWMGLVALSLVLGACEEKASREKEKSATKEDDDDDDDKKKKKKKSGSSSASAASASTAPAAPTPAPTPTPAPSPTTPPDAAPTTTAEAPPPPPPPVPTPAGGRSAVPTQAEWAAQTKEVGVRGSAALGCETKQVREWLRVSCRGTNDTGGKPTALRFISGDSKEAFTFASGGITSLVIPYEEGINSVYVFSWTDKSHKLVLSWPRGAPKPALLGVFQGAASPLDAR